MDSEAGISSKFSDEQEVFEIRDYTTASEWERFISAFEEVLVDWQLVGNDSRIVELHLSAKDLANAEWHEQTTTIEFVDYCFNVTHHYASLKGNSQPKESTGKEFEGEEELPQYLLQTINTEVDFASKSHCITRWYGLQQFIILSAAPNMEPLTSHTRTKLVLSALSIAANNTNCQLPLFVQTRNKEDKVFSGLAMSNGVRTNFDMSYVKKVASRLTHLDGFMTILREKLSIDKKYGADVTVKFTYKMCTWPNTLLVHQVPDYDPLTIDLDFSKFTELPFGAVDDPVSAILLSTFRPHFFEYFDRPTETYERSRLNPKFLKTWSVRVEPPNYLGRSLIAGIMRAFVDTAHNRLSIRQILGAEFDPLLVGELDVGLALNKITSTPVPFLANVMSRTPFYRQRQPAVGPLCDNVLTQLLQFLFPDSCEDETFKYPACFSQIPTWNQKFEQMPEEPPLKTVFANLKSCSIGSFVWRLTIVSQYCIMSIGKGALAQLIYELYLELKFRWDNSLLIPGVESGLPNLATCLFNQKIQMLNYCIAKRREKEGKSKEKTGVSEECESDDEFFECNEDADDASDEENLPEWDKPVGRLKRLHNLRLLNSRAFLYVPVTQSTPPVTEDRLEQQRDDLVRLGSDASASNHRARVMSISLLSDMESFKAANPGCVLGDFVRWYSPRDWLQDQEGNGRLSERMRAPGNLWEEVWQSAVPVPTRRQKRLFDETRESQSVLQWVGSLAPGALCRELLPVLAHACLARITEEHILYTLPASVSVLPMPVHCRMLLSQLELVAQRVLRITRHTSPDLATYESLLEQLRAIEIDISRGKSLRLKILGYTHVTSATFKHSSTASSFSEATASPTNLGHAEIPVETSDPHSEAMSGNSDSRPAETDQIECPDPDQAKEEILEKFIFDLLSSQEISIDDSPAGSQSTALIKLFDAGIKENQRLKEGEEAEVQESAIPHGYDNPDNFFLGPPFAREYLIRTKAKFPATYSRMLPHRIFVVALPSEFRMAGAITQDTLFC